MNDLFSNSLFSDEEYKNKISNIHSSEEQSFSDFLKNVSLDNEDTMETLQNEAIFQDEYVPYNNYSEYHEHPGYTIPENFLEGMNPEQTEAVLYDQGSLLVLAGAGSGKTRVITHRFAHLVQKYQLGIHNILCVTFTNKAAGEMKERIGHLLGVNTRTIWVRTFHSMCTMILREHAHRIGYSKDFTIYDASNTKNAIKKIMTRLNIDPKEHSDKAIARTISTAKEEMISPEEMAKNARNPFDQMTAEVYKEYKKTLHENQAMDFGDLIINTILLLENCSDVQERYHRQWRFVMADEFQDTNKPQYRLLCLLSKDRNNVCVVGDDDQSIYGWRGARVENIKQFQQEFQAHIIRLERNYRSFGNILTAANSVVKSIKGRMPKTLKAVRESGDKITVKTLGDDRLQAAYLYDEITSLMQEKNKDFKDFAVLYRTNSQSRILEEVFTRHRVPHVIYGGQRFFDRAEIKDILSYLRVIVNPKDEEAFDRIVNIPKRKIGDVGKTRIWEFVQFTGCSFTEACLRADEINGIGKAVVGSLVELGKILTELKESVETSSPTNILKILLESIRYFEAYLVQNYGSHEAEDRLENVQELMNAVREFEKGNPNTTIADYLREASLLSSLHEDETDQDNKVSLMTIHSAKGLEYPIVFVIGVSEGIIPLSRFESSDSKDNSSEMEEEKRLFYVAVTRAMDKLYLTYAQESIHWGNQTRYNDKSHFIDMIPTEILDQKTEPVFSRDEFRNKYRSKSQDYSKNHKTTSSYKKNHIHSQKQDSHSVKEVFAPAESLRSEKVTSMADLDIGQKVIHTMWGIGSIEYVSAAMVKVSFDSFGTQVLMGSAVTNLKKIVD